jgi:methyl-accepting chemotaxis protein
MLLGYYSAKKISNRLGDLAGQLGNVARTLSNTAQSVSTSSNQLSESTVEQAAAIQETSASVDEINAMVGKTAQNAQNSEANAQSSLDRIQEGQSALHDMIESLNHIQNSNHKIIGQMESNVNEFGTIVNLINDIASKTKVINDIVFQTKLLSFNASVEAARAGEHGKGFAVVAEEVGNLAQMSGNAAREIASMLDDSVKKVNAIALTSKQSVQELVEKGRVAIENGNQNANRCKEAFDTIMGEANHVSTMLSEIAQASKEQSIGIQEVTKAMAQLDQVTQQNSSISQETANASVDLATQSSKLTDLMETLKEMIYGQLEELNQDQDDHQESDHKSIEKSKKAAKVYPLTKSKPLPEVKITDSKLTKKASGYGMELPSRDDPGFEEV